MRGISKRWGWLLRTGGPTPHYLLLPLYYLGKDDIKLD